MRREDSNTHGFQWVMFTALLLLVIAPLAMPTYVLASRSGSGYFYMQYTDFVSSDERILLHRIYNSNADKRGLFGKQWGSPLDTYIGITGDGTVVVHENGSGRREVFRSAAVTEASIEKCIALILAAAKKAGDFPNGIQSITDEMRVSDKFREQLWSMYVREKRLPMIELPVGSVLHAVEDDFGEQRLMRTEHGYIRFSWLDTLTFNLDGEVMSFSHVVKSHKSMTKDMRYHRGEDGALLAASNGDGSEILFFSRNSHGETTAIIDQAGKIQCAYSYKKGRLVRSKDGSDNVYTYDYDHQGRLVSIGYEDGSMRVMQYDDDGLLLSEKKIR